MTVANHVRALPVGVRVVAAVGGAVPVLPDRSDAAEAEAVAAG